MKKLLLSCLGICLFSSVSFAIVDQKCMSGCIADGYSSWQCQQACERGNLIGPIIPKTKQIDPKCFRDCRSQGYSYGYCQEQCSYDE